MMKCYKDDRMKLEQRVDKDGNMIIDCTLYFPTHLDWVEKEKINILNEFKNGGLYNSKENAKVEISKLLGNSEDDIFTDSKVGE